MEVFLVVDIILTADETFMNNYHLKTALSTPSYGSPESLPKWLFQIMVRNPKKKSNGEVVFAPYPLRKIEAKIIQGGFEVKTLAPKVIPKYIDSAKILGLNTVNPLGLASMPSSRQFLTSNIDYSVIYFRKLLENKAVRKAKKNGLKIIVGGAGAWQFKNNPKIQKELGIDVVIIGEGENIVNKVITRCLRKDKVPGHIECEREDIPELKDIPCIKNASNYGCVELGRGCVRGCKFCEVWKNRVRWIPYDNIEKELRLNAKYGIKQGLLTAEDILLYGENDVIPNIEKLIKLIKLTQRYYQRFHLTCFSLAAVSAQPKVIPKCMEIILEKQNFILGETGIETGSQRLLSKTMSGKLKPFTDQKWTEIIHNSLGILHDNSLIPYCSLILGLPGEMEDDINQTLDLLDDLKKFKCFFIPLNFTPLGEFADNKGFPINISKIDELHKQVIQKCFQHNILWLDHFKNDLFQGPNKNFLMKLMLNFWKYKFEKKARKAGLGI
jgi:radical SAM superfamily enzyme YgiQ (UPF0313 family)